MCTVAKWYFFFYIISTEPSTVEKKLMITSLHDDFEFLAGKKKRTEKIALFPGERGVVTRTIPSKNSYNYYDVLL